MPRFLNWTSWVPDLLVFVACEKVIISQDENNPTLVGLLSSVGASIDLPLGEPLPENAAIPFPWAVFSNWHMLPGEEGREFQQRVVMEAPDGRELINQTLPFTLQKESHRVTLRMKAMPHADNGLYRIRCFLTPGADGDEELVATYPLRITIVRAAETSPDASS